MNTPLTFNDGDRELIRRAKNYLLQEIEIRLKDLPFELSEKAKGCILSGGAISSAILGAFPNDYDMYFGSINDIKNFEESISRNMDYVKEVAEYYTTTTVKGKLITANAITLKNGLQFITLGTKDIRSTFDYIHCMPWIDISNKKLHMSYEQYLSIRNKKLIVNKSSAKEPSLHRKQKFLDRGWVATNPLGDGWITDAR